MTSRSHLASTVGSTQLFDNISKKLGQYELIDGSVKVRDSILKIILPDKEPGQPQFANSSDFNQSILSLINGKTSNVKHLKRPNKVQSPPHITNNLLASNQSNAYAHHTSKDRMSMYKLSRKNSPKLNPQFRQGLSGDYSQVSYHMPF